MSGVQQPFGTTYEYVAPSTSAQVLGSSGAVGDTLVSIVATVATAATGTVSITDGSNTYSLVPATTPVGVYTIELNIASQSSGWKVTTGAGASALAIGNFS